MAPKIKEALGIQQAMDNLAAIISIDMESPPPLWIVQKNRIVTEKEELGPDHVQWLSEEGCEMILNILDATYRSIHQHLLSLYENPEMNWENEKSRKGISAMMDLVGESASKIELYLTYRLGKPCPYKIAETPEFKALQQFYATRFSKKFIGGIEGDEAWSKEWSENEEATLFDVTKTGLMDFETVRRDREYELFYIRNEAGKPYFSAELLRNIKLTCDFDADSESFEEDPLLKTRSMQDRDFHASAAQILGDCHPIISEFFKNISHLGSNTFASELSKAILALLLAANPRYLLQNTNGKSCLQYFDDFLTFLRSSMRTDEYQKLIAYPPEESDKISRMLLFLAHVLSRSFFERIGGVKQESIGLIHRTMRRGEEIKQSKNKRQIKGDTVWNQFQIDDEKLRTLLAKFPNGPLFKILDIVRSEEEGVIPFDPIGQSNLPSRNYEIQVKEKRIDVLRLPSPTRQSLINKVEILDEFRGYLRSIGAEKPIRKLLMINLQDRTSWREYSRSQSLEMLQMNAEFSSQFFVLTLPKETDFYYQTNEYLNLNQAEEFLAAFKAQLEKPEECGFFLPPVWKQADFNRFCSALLPLVHEHFFHGKNTLPRRNREDFIEIFYQFLILKCIDLIEPNTLCFSSKDAVDTAAGELGTFYGFVKLIVSDFTKKEEQDFLRWLLYSPALFVRERAIDPECFNRTISALERIDGEMAERGKAILKAFGALYHSQTFKTLGIRHL
ncbi:MAG: hypothetical protein V4487_03915 [Chlamydiota bacterium]